VPDLAGSMPVAEELDGDRGSACAACAPPGVEARPEGEATFRLEDAEPGFDGGAPSLEAGRTAGSSETLAPAEASWPRSVKYCAVK